VCGHNLLNICIIISILGFKYIRTVKTIIQFLLYYFINFIPYLYINVDYNSSMYIKNTTQ